VLPAVVVAAEEQRQGRAVVIPALREAARQPAGEKLSGALFTILSMSIQLGCFEPPLNCTGRVVFRVKCLGAAMSTAVGA
jgi:hypothetical protein